MVPVSAVTTMVADAATTAASGLSCYYSSAAATMVLYLAETAADVTLVVDANPTGTQKEECKSTPLFYFYCSPAKTTSVNITAHGTI